MVIAQKLFEGIEIGEKGRVGLITYMRTDAVRIAQKAKDEAKKYIKERFGKEFIPEKPYTYKTKSSAQGAHEAIRPTSIDRNPDEIKGYLNNNEYRLYKLIWKRFLASQMVEAKYHVLILKVKGGKFLFQAESRKLTFPGYRKIFSSYISVLFQVAL
jgi:DNA topoisomerase-1